MKLTERERLILQLEKEGLTDYRIARKIRVDPPTITRSRRNAHMKLKQAQNDIEYAQQLGLRIN